MFISHIAIKNWKNFLTVDVDLSQRTFIVGANSSGKSNFLDVFRFLRDICKAGGGLQKSIELRGGISKIRCLFARSHPTIEIEATLSDDSDNAWKYSLGISQPQRGVRSPQVKYEKVWKNGVMLLNRPNDNDNRDPELLKQTHLEQISANHAFREISKYFQSIIYLHLIPQLLRYPEMFGIQEVSEDPFGRSFLERVKKTPKKKQQSRLKIIEKALQTVVPQLKEFSLVSDVKGAPHLQVKFEHWRPGGAYHQENQLSDGTLRLIGLLWSLLENDSLLLLEEPELSLNAGIVERLPNLIYNLTLNKKRQILLSTHSEKLLSDDTIGGEEVLLLELHGEATQVKRVSDISEARALLEGGATVGDAIIPRTEPKNIDKLRIS